MGKLGCVAIVKNEERHIAEWLAWQLCCGFDTILLLDNASTDRTAEVARGFAPRWDVRLEEWPATGPDYQSRAYEFAARKLAGECEWLAFFDTDEFLVLEEGGELRALLAGRPEAAIGINWAVFGSSGHRDAPEGLVTTGFLNRSGPDFPPNRHFKSIIRPERMRACLNPHAFDCGSGYVDLTGRALTQQLPGYLAREPDYAGGKLHHYFTRSRAHWQQKLQRGYPDITRKAEEFTSYDRNEVFDDSACRLACEVTGLLGRIGGPMPGSCAVVLVVKDEASDIASWLAWYHVLGFDACIVFDDDSTDGTWELLQLAARAQDIRLHRTQGPRDVHDDVRRSISYQFALAQYADAFEWLAFFDADEYLSLFQDVSIKSFLARFEQADQVLVNWCNYGSSGHYLKPAQLSVEAYTWHGDAHRPINRHVKAIVRPRRVGSEWICVHCFDVPPERSCLANGAQVAWSAQLGIIDSNPDWSVAKLMHYQCRSMEHFIERLKKYPEFQNQPGLWEADDLRQMEDTRPLRLSGRVQAQMARIMDLPAPGANPDLIFDIGMSEGNDTAFYLAKGFNVVGVEPDVKTYYRLLERFAPAIAAGRLVIHNFAAGARHGEIVEFFHHARHQGLSGLSHHRPEFAQGYDTYHVMTIDWPALTAQHGVPYYAKIDIEGGEAAFLSGAVHKSPLPVYISIECHGFAPVQVLYDLGYRRFMLVDQKPPGGFQLPVGQAEGRQVSWRFEHASGPFGRDLEGEWVDFAVFKGLWEAARPRCAETWFDCHAWMP